MEKKTEKNRTAKNFAGLEKEFSDYKTARAVVIPIPYEKTTTYIKGTAAGPQAIIDASKYVELYDEETERVISDIGIATLAPVIINDGPEIMVGKVKNHCAKVLKDNKFPVVLGGEHSVSVGFFHALKERYPDLSVLQFDAHADLRNEYESSCYNHACVMARIREKAKVVQVGVRSLSEAEAKKAKKENYKIIWAKEVRSITGCIREIIDNLSDNVFITVDVDGFDPMLIPAVGTPEPGGLGWYDFLEIVKAVFLKKNVVAFDAVELCPIKNQIASDFIIAKMIYKMLAYKFFTKKATVNTKKGLFNKANRVNKN